MLQSKLLKGGYVGDSVRDYYRKLQRGILGFLTKADMVHINPDLVYMIWNPQGQSRYIQKKACARKRASRNDLDTYGSRENNTKDFSHVGADKRKRAT